MENYFIANRDKLQEICEREGVDALSACVILAKATGHPYTEKEIQEYLKDYQDRHK